MAYGILIIIPLIAGWLLDLIFGDPARLPHPVVLFGKVISAGEHRLNRGTHRRLKGALMALSLTFATWVVMWLICRFTWNITWLWLAVSAVAIFYCLAGTTLYREVRMVFEACARSLDEGRRQVARIVGRDTSQLSAREIRTAALETLAENLNDGVVAPLFWLAVGGIPAMMAYKMINTLDSMIGYRTERYRRFGTIAARLDDIAGWIPARLTALLMLVASGRPRLIGFVVKYGPCHASPNSGYPEAALAGILGCRFGGDHIYFGELISKPHIGYCGRELTDEDMTRSISVCRGAELLAVIIAVIGILLMGNILPGFIF